MSSLCLLKTSLLSILTIPLEPNPRLGFNKKGSLNVSASNSKLGSTEESITKGELIDELGKYL